MQRVKNVDYDEDDLYDDEEDGYGDKTEEYSAEDKQNFATLTPVVRAELEEAGVQASDMEIEDSLWHYFWDVEKSVSYLKTSKAPKPQQQLAVKKEKAKSKFDQAAESSAKKAGECMSLIFGDGTSGPGRAYIDHYGRGGAHPSSHAEVLQFLTLTPSDFHQPPPMLATEWFRDTPWSQLPQTLEGVLVPLERRMPSPKLLGGSSKLAKLAEERRRKAASAASQAPASSSEGALSALDRLSKPKESKENDIPGSKSEPKKYPIRKKREPTPPPREPTPPPAEVEEEKPDLRASPTAFGRTLSTGSHQDKGAARMALKDILNSEIAGDPFQGPSPDDTVIRAQQHSKGLTK